MVKKLPTKSDLRAELEAQTRKFLNKGGEVDRVPRGLSGKDPAQAPTYLAKRLFTEPKTSRTHVPEVVAAIEARKQNLRKRAAPKRRGLARPRRKTIYDDFGEPLRKVWVDE